MKNEATAVPIEWFSHLEPPKPKTTLTVVRNYMTNVDRIDWKSIAYAVSNNRMPHLCRSAEYVYIFAIEMFDGIQNKTSSSNGTQTSQTLNGWMDGFAAISIPHAHIWMESILMKVLHFHFVFDQFDSRKWALCVNFVDKLYTRMVPQCAALNANKYTNKPECNLFNGSAAVSTFMTRRTHARKTFGCAWIQLNWMREIVAQNCMVCAWISEPPPQHHTRGWISFPFVVISTFTLA